MAGPTTPEEWLDTLTEIVNSIDGEIIEKAYTGDAAARAIVEAWAKEVEAAVIFLLGYEQALNAAGEALLAMANAVVDTLQAILIALGIAYLLKRFRKKKDSSAILEIVVSSREAQSIAGDRAKPIPSRDTDSQAQEAAFLTLRMQWLMHFVMTLFQAQAIQDSMDLADGEELVWVSRKDSSVCTICRYMDGKKSKGGDFLPILLAKFPEYVPYIPIMPFPHAHPRCRCVCKPERSTPPDVLTEEQQSGKSDTTK